jgi:probable phosphoglycerate mutase
MLWVRHGQTPANAAGVLLGRHDPSLTDLGLDQVRAVAGLVAAAEPGVIVTSPLRRARQSAAVLAEACGAPVVVDERAVEIDYGDWDGHRLDDVPPEVLARWRRDAEFRPPGGESLADVGRRVAALCRELAHDAAAGPSLVVVSHVSPIKAAVCWAVGIDDAASWRMHVGLASVTRIGVRHGVPYLAGFNEGASGADHRPA